MALGVLPRASGIGQAPRLDAGTRPPSSAPPTSRACQKWLRALGGVTARLGRLERFPSFAVQRASACSWRGSGTAPARTSAWREREAVRDAPCSRIRPASSAAPRARPARPSRRPPRTPRPSRGRSRARPRPPRAGRRSSRPPKRPRLCSTRYITLSGRIELVAHALSPFRAPLSMLPASSRTNSALPPVASTSPSTVFFLRFRWKMRAHELRRVVASAEPADPAGGHTRPRAAGDDRNARRLSLAVDRDHQQPRRRRRTHEVAQQLVARAIGGLQVVEISTVRCSLSRPTREHCRDGLEQAEALHVSAHPTAPAGLGPRAGGCFPSSVSSCPSPGRLAACLRSSVYVRPPALPRTADRQRALVVDRPRCTRPALSSSAPPYSTRALRSSARCSSRPIEVRLADPPLAADLRLPAARPPCTASRCPRE